MNPPDGLRSSPYSIFYPDDLETGWRDLWGMAYPFHVGDPAAEYHALRNACALMEYSMLYRWDVDGPGAIEAIDLVYSRDVAAMEVGQIAYGVFVDDDGKMVDDVTVFRTGEHRLWVIGGNLEANDELIRDASPDGVTVTQRRDETAQLSVQGPKSREILQSITTADLSNDAVPYYTFLSDVEIGGVTGQLNRMGFTAELGYEFICAVEDVEKFGRAILTAGEPHGIRWAGLTTMMPARLEGGMIMADLEYDHTSTPFECRLGWTVDFDKGPFRGRDALLAAKGTAPDCVVTVIIEGDHNIIMAPVTVDGEEVGVVTRAVPSPTFGVTLGLARVRREHAATGTTLTSVDAEFSAEVVKTPMYDPERTRVKG